MSKKVAITAKNFSSILSGQVTAFGKFRDRIQDLLAFAMVQASSANYTYVNAIINAKLTGVDRRSIQTYIEDHNDLQLLREDGSFKFKSAKTKGFKFVMPEITWFEYAPTAEPKAISAPDGILATIRRLTVALKGEGKAFIAKGHVKETKDIIAHLAKTPGLDKTKLKSALAA